MMAFQNSTKDDSSHATDADRRDESSKGKDMDV
jgi:hypothetical protein